MGACARVQRLRICSTLVRSVVALSLPFSPLISAPTVSSVFFLQVVDMSYSWSRYSKPCGSATATTNRNPILRHGRRPQTSQRVLYMVCGRLTNRLVISPTRKSSTRVAQGMIHEMELRVPLLHTATKKAWTASGPCQRMQHYGPSHSRWRRDALQPPEVPQPHCARDTCVHISESGLRCASWNARGLLGSTASSQTSREQKHRYLKRRVDKIDVVCVQETHGKDEFLQALQVLHTQFRMFGIFMLDIVNAGGSEMFIRKHLLPDQAVVTHEVTYQSRDHIIKVQFGESFLVIINCTL